MDEGLDRESTAVKHPGAEADRIAHDIEVVRGNLGGLVGELDHRRHELFDVRGQLRRHAVPLAIGAATVLALIAGGVAFYVARERRRQRPVPRLQRLRLALSRMVDHPERVATGGPSVALKLATAAGTAGAGALARHLVTRTVRE